MFWRACLEQRVEHFSTPQVWAGGHGDDMGKSPHLVRALGAKVPFPTRGFGCEARIANSVFPDAKDLASTLGAAPTAWAGLGVW